ncbi:MAG: hypothetical protein ABIQ13_05355 [Pedococcus sp.]
MTKMTPRVAPAPFARLASVPITLIVAGALAGCGGAGEDPTVTATTTPTTPTTASRSTSTSAAGSSTSSGSPTSSSAAAPSSSPAGRTLRITVQGKKVTPAPSTVDLAVGKTLTLIITSDHDDEVHVHGFEVEATLESGRPTSVTLTGKDPGVYEVETHETALRLLKIAVR